MAWYEYLCGDCGREFEVEQKISDDPLPECPKCREDGKDSSPPKKLISLSAFALKGGGWADSGYGNK
jgi:putative FmdB family regulatory protein